MYTSQKLCVKMKTFAMNSKYTFTNGFIKESTKSLLEWMTEDKTGMNNKRCQYIMASLFIYHHHIYTIIAECMRPEQCAANFQQFLTSEIK